MELVRMSSMDMIYLKWAGIIKGFDDTKYNQMEIYLKNGVQIICNKDCKYYFSSEKVVKIVNSNKITFIGLNEISAIELWC